MPFAITINWIFATRFIALDGLKPINVDMAHPNKTPTTEQVREIDRLIKGKRYQEAIDKAVSYYGIDTGNVNGGIQFDKSLSGEAAVTGSDRTVRIPSRAFELDDSRAAFLASTIIHEVTHANQYQRHGHHQVHSADKVDQQSLLYEAMAYRAEAMYADKLGTTAARKQDYTDKLEGLKGSMNPVTRRLFETGRYYIPPFNSDPARQPAPGATR